MQTPIDVAPTRSASVLSEDHAEEGASKLKSISEVGEPHENSGFSESIQFDSRMASGVMLVSPSTSGLKRLPINGTR